jgi:[lysine-biosynthesis-protein LysW]--L-2-aminoadipate ligase
VASLLIAGRITPTNVALLDAVRSAGDNASLLPPEDVPGRIRAGDVVLGRVDVAPTLTGAEAGLGVLRRLQHDGVLVLNPASTLRAMHDKLATARLLAWHGIAHPETVHVRRPDEPVALEPPVVVKPRHGSWGADVVLCRDRDELQEALWDAADRDWFRSRGALVQEFVPAGGEDIRILVAVGAVTGAIARTAAPAEWRTNVALGGTRRSVDPPAEAARLAMLAAAAVGADLAGVDLLRGPRGWVVLELNGCVDFTREYGFGGRDVFGQVARTLLHPCYAAELGL